MTKKTALADLATEPQIAALRQRAERYAMFGDHLNYAETHAHLDTLIADGLTKSDASDLMSNAWGNRHDPATTPMSESTHKYLLRFAKEKALFGLHVTVEETIARVEAMGGVASAADADALYRKSWNAPPHPTSQTPLRLDAIEGIDDLDISEGFYAVFDTDNVLRHYRIYSPATGALRGVPVIRRYAGDMLMALYPEEARKALRDIDVNPDEAAYRYADTFTRCWVCGKNLTDSISRLLSVGPTCRGFTSHSGLKAAGAANDADPKRRNTYRAIRAWMQEKGLVDPKNREERSIVASVTASQVASAWCSVDGVMDKSPEDAVALVANAYSGDADLDDATKAALLSTRADVIAILIESGLLSQGMMNTLNGHKSKKVRDIVAQKFLDLLMGTGV